MNSSDEQRAKRQQLKVAFDIIDVDRSGAISSRDLRGALRGLGVRLSQQEVDALVKEANSAGAVESATGATGGGSAHDVEFPEFCDIMMAKEREIEVARAMGFNVEARREKKEPAKPVFALSKAKADEAKRIFNSYDFELAGVLEVDQIRSALEVLGFKKTEDEVATIVAGIDKFGTGQLNYNEFLAVVTAENERASGFGGDIKQTALHILQELGKTDFTSPNFAADSDFGASSPAETIVRPVGRSGMSSQSTMRGAMWSLIVIEAIIIVLFGACCEVNISPEADSDFTNTYVMYTGVALMMFFGYGYLMTYLKRYGMGAVAFSMLVTVISIQWGVLCEAFFKELYNTEGKKSWDFVQLDLSAFTEALILAAACLISMGAVIGKASPLQIIVMAFFECIFYSVNKNLLLEGVVDVQDAGSSIKVHIFGAYFGLAVAWVIGKPFGSPDAEGGHVSDIFSLLGTLFLWIYWPCFNGALLVANSSEQQRAVINTIVALVGSTVTAFALSAVLSDSQKFRPVDIQNATIAGGVAIGAVANLTLNLSDALLIGCAGGLVATFGFARVQKFVEDRFNIHDTCGVHNLHGLPGLLGGICSVILAAIKVTDLGHDHPDPYSKSAQAGDQMVAIVFTLAVSIASGLVVGGVLAIIRPDENSIDFYCDEPYWEIMDDFGRSMKTHNSNMARGLEQLQQGLQASAALRGIMNNFSKLELPTAAPTVATKPRKEKRGGLDVSIHNSAV